MKKIVFLIGKNFLEFTSNKEVLCVSEFLKKYQTNMTPPDIEYRLGQGISSKEIEKIREIFNKNNSIVNFSDREDKRFVHKTKNKNVMITKPATIEDNLFSSFLMLDKECAEMSDHVTGQHIQGMVIIEAARQMMLSVTENYLLNNIEQGKTWVILNDIQVKFSSLLFPLEIRIDCLMKNNDDSNAKGQYMAEIKFVQNEKLSCEVEILFSLYPKDKLARGEGQLAQKSINLAIRKNADSTLNKY